MFRTSKSRVVARLAIIVPFAALALSCGGSGTDSNMSAATVPPLGTAAGFAVLGGETVTNTGPTVVTGDLGVSPGSAVTGFPPGLVIGAIHAADAVALQAQNDNTAAYLDLAGQACDVDLTGTDLVGLTLTAGVYCFSSSAQLSGALTLDAEGDPDAVFVFQIVSTLTTASSASVDVINGGQDCNVFWQVGSSATIGTDTTFVGSILALTSISLNTGASISGRAMAQTGAVTMDANTVSFTSCSTTTPDGGMPECCADLTMCDGTCLNLDEDSHNCGSCGHQCAEDRNCINGACIICAKDVCGEGTACVDFLSDDDNCGGCDIACASGESCVDGYCGGACL